MSNVSKIKTLYAYEDGDTITPRMGVQIATGHGLQQFYNAETHQVTNTDFGTYHATLFPQPYSSKAGAVVVPAAGGQWYFNNPGNSDMGILDGNGVVKQAFADRFEVTTVTVNGKTFPALTIKANLVNPTNQISTDIYIYYSGTYGSKTFMCSQCIPVQSVVGDAYQLLVSCPTDEIISDDQETLTYTAFLQMMSTGTNVQGVQISFQRFGNNGWEDVTHNTGITEITTVSEGKQIKIFHSAVDGAELFRAHAVYNGQHYYKTFEPTDEHDPYYIVDGCSIEGDSVKRSDTVTWNPKVYKRHNGPGEEDEDVTTSEGWTFTYTLIGQRTGETITSFNQTGITFERLTQHGGIATRIQASRS